MFITVMFGAGCWELVNTWCNLVTLTAHLRQKGQVSPDEGEDGAPTRYESLLENLDDQYPELAGESHGRAPGGGCTFSPAPIGRASWAFQRSFAACQAYNPQAMAGGGAQALGVITRSRALFQGHEGRAPCHPGPASWDQEPGCTPPPPCEEGAPALACSCSQQPGTCRYRPGDSPAGQQPQTSPLRCA
ncbi:uncharacterized protein C22orf15 homolog isoform X2 [Crocuta crocuta]